MINFLTMKDRQHIKYMALLSICLFLLLFAWANTKAQQPNVQISGTVTDGPSGAPLTGQPVFFTISPGNDSLISYTEMVMTSDSGHYYYAFYLQVNTARVEVSTPDCNGSMLTETVFVSAGSAYVIDLEVCTMNLCQAFFVVEQTGDLSFSFSNQSSGQGLSYFWDFGDNNISWEQNPQHTYQQPGIYEVCLYISTVDSLCFDTYCNTLIAGNSGGCLARFSFYPDSVQSLYGVQFLDLSNGNITEWQWDFGDGTASTLQNPLHVFPGTGTYSVCLSIAGPECQSTWCMPVYVTAAGDCFNYFTYQSSDNSVVFEGFHSLGLPAVYSWDFGDGVSGEGQTVVHEYPLTGTYYVTLNTIDSFGCVSSSSQTIVLGDTIIFNQVYGQVMAGNFPISSVKVVLASMENNPGFSPLIQEVSVDGSGVFVFPYVPNGMYYLSAVPDEFSGYLPTYYGGAMHWEEAEKVSFTGTLSDPHVINLSAGRLETLTGFGSVSGSITGSAGVSGLLDKIRVLLYDEQFEPVVFSDVTPDGVFAFSGLENGTYYLYPDLPGSASSYLRIDISDVEPNSVVSLSFTGNSMLGEGEPILADPVGQIWPNPVNETAHLTVHFPEPCALFIAIIDLSGRVVSTTRCQTPGGEYQIQIPAGDLKQGLYHLRISAESGLNLTRKFISR